MKFRKSAKARLISAALLIIILSLLTSCGGGDGKKNDDVTTKDASVTTGKQIDETTRKPLAVPGKDFGGHTFNVLSFTRGPLGSALQYLDFSWSTDSAGDLINDAIYSRNLIVEERYNITIKNIEVASPVGTGRKAVLAGEDSYDVIMPYINESFTLAQENLLIDFFDVPQLDITNDWWDQAIIRDLALNGKIYVMTGDISMADEELNYGVFFNKALVNEYNLEDCYQLVRENKWVLDKMHALAKTVTHDLNGDGILGEADVYGILTDYSIAPIWFFSLGGQLAGLNSEGVPELRMNSERTVNVIEGLAEMLQDKEATLNVVDTKGSWTGFDNMLMEDRALFRVGSIYDIQFFRVMVNDFGVLPYPKFNEDQDDFYHIIATQVCMGLCIPNTASDLERTGIILEALGYESKDTVTKAYYDINLYTKVARDDESGEMFDIIFTTKRYDLAKVFGWGGLEDVLRNAVKKGQSFASLYATAEPKAMAQMEKSYEFFK